MGTFQCKDCKMDFEVQNPEKKEYRDPIYGYCWKYVSFCPECNSECTEKSKPKPGKKNQSSNPKSMPEGGCPGGCGCGL